MKYIALSDGFTDRYIKKGETFHFDGPKGRWMHPAEEPLPPGVAEPEYEVMPDTNSEIQKGKKKTAK